MSGEGKGEAASDARVPLEGLSHGVSDGSWCGEWIRFNEDTKDEEEERAGSSTGRLNLVQSVKHVPVQ